MLRAEPVCVSVTDCVPACLCLCVCVTCYIGLAVGQAATRCQFVGQKLCRRKLLAYFMANKGIVAADSILSPSTAHIWQSKRLKSHLQFRGKRPPSPSLCATSVHSAIIFSINQRGKSNSLPASSLNSIALNLLLLFFEQNGFADFYQISATLIYCFIKR